MAVQAAGTPVLLAGYSIPWDVWQSIYNYARNVAQVAYPFTASDSCWKLALYLGICACETSFQNLEGDPAESVYSGPGGTCCSYYACLDAVSCPGGVTAWDKARAHAPYGSYGAYLSHGWFQLYVCGQGAGYICDPASLHDIGLHMSIALPHIGNAIVSYWNDSAIEQSCRTIAQASGHPGWVGDYDYRVTNIWNATQAIQPDLRAFLLGGVPPAGLVVTLYEHTQYTGNSVALTADTPDFNPIGFNDIVSSIKIEGATGTPSITLYQHTQYLGAALTLTESDPDLSQHMMTDTLSWNDQASSLTLTAPAPPPFPPSPLPPFPVPAQTLGPSPLPPIPSVNTNPLPPLP